MKALYVTNRRAAGRERLEALLRAFAGAKDLTVELRERETSDRETLLQARRARDLLGERVPLLINRRFDVALAAGADGVHLPASGLPVGLVRTNTPRGFRIGVSTHSCEQALAAIEEGADLVLIGPIFDTPSKRAFGPPLGPGELAGLPLASTHPTQVYAIGGVGEATLERLLPYRDRVSGVAAIRLFQDAADPLAALARVTSL